MSDATHNKSLGIFWRTIGALLPMAALLLLSTPAAAVPSFARQVNAECSACHFQHQPKLTAFGRAFKAGGFSQTSQEVLGGEGLSLSPVLNASFFIKTRIVDTDTGSPQWQVPDEAALLLGGRLAEGIGGLVELSDEILSYKVSLTRMLNSGQTVGATVFTTDGLGAAYGFELLNTGVLRNSRPFERSSRPTTSGPLDLSGGTTGAALHAYDPDWFAALTFFLPDDRITGATERDTGSDLANYLRAAWTPTLGAWDSGFGVGILTGSAEATDASTGTRTTFEANAWLVDAQLQGMLGDRVFSAYFVYGQGDDRQDAGDTVYLHNAGHANAPKAWGLDMEYNLNPRLSVLFGYGSQDNGDSTQSAKNNTVVGLYWKLAQNISLTPSYEHFTGDQASMKHRTTIQLETAF